MDLPNSTTASPGKPIAAAAGALPHMGVVLFTGPDTLSFLQGQLSNDTDRLRAGAPLLAAYSTPQGRVVAVLHLLPHSTGTRLAAPGPVCGGRFPTGKHGALL